MPTALISPIASLATGGMGLLGNLTGGKQQNKILGQQQQMQSQAFNNLQNQLNKWSSMTPAQMAQGVNQMVPTLQANLVRSVAAQTDPATAESGLAGSQGALQNNLGLALAPYQQQNQQQALQGYEWLGQLPTQIAGTQGNLIQNMGQFLQQPTGGSGALFGQGLQGLLGALGGGGTGLQTIPTTAQQTSQTWSPGLGVGWAGSIPTNTSSNAFTGFGGPTNFG